VQTDLDEAYACGRAAVTLAHDGASGVMVTLVRESNVPYRCTTGTAPLAEVAVRAKPMPDSFINAAGNYPTEAFLDYLRPLVGNPEYYARLQYKNASPTL
jgi:6-phosphofructokinase 1